MRTNFHTHTVRCHHARGTEREFIEAAIAAGMTELGFSDHSPYPFSDGHVSHFRMSLEETAEYFETLRALQAEYADRIAIHLGFEAEYYPRYFEAMREHVRSFGCEYLILGQHFLYNEVEGIYSGTATDEEARLAQYVDQVLEGLATGAYTYLAHPDLVTWTGEEEVCRRQMLRLCRGVKAMDIPLEINLLGLYESRQYPNELFWQIAGECGCEAIVGFDAHEPEALGRAQTAEKALELARRCGLQVLERPKELRRP
jgi:histidinol-phosphatase (PHP family)